jgi:hypothetical protein
LSCFNFVQIVEVGALARHHPRPRKGNAMTTPQTPRGGIAGMVLPQNVSVSSVSLASLRREQFL